MHKVSKLIVVSDYLLWRVLDVYVHAARFYEDFSDIRTSGLDETSVAKGHEYITLFVDMEKKGNSSQLTPLCLITTRRIEGL